jgi:2-methylcitrate dehydratase PrpD
MSEAYSLIEQLAKHLQRPVDDATRDRARLHLLDWLGCLAGARESAVGKIGSISLPGIAGTTALLGNVLEMDDVYRKALLHPGPIVWATCMHHTPEAVVDMLDMAVRGYEAMIAVGATFDAHHYSFWHPTATAGAIGAAAATSSYYCPTDATAAGWAMANAASVAGGLWHMRHDDVMTKQWHILSAVRTGGEAAWLAMDGLTGPRFILEGPQGLYAAICKEPKPMTLPDQWRIHEVSFKPWAACRHAHPAIDCALELRAAGKLTPPFVVETYADAIAFCDNPNPRTEAQAKFSIQHAVAAIADGRDAGPADFTPEAIAALAELRAQVAVSESPDITARYPAHFGARLNGLELIDTRGDPERPLDRDGVIAKARTLIAWGGLEPAEGDRAVELALVGDETAAISEMLQDWLQ